MELYVAENEVALSIIECVGRIFFISDDVILCGSYFCEK